MKKTPTLTIFALLLAAVVPSAIFTLGLEILTNMFSYNTSNQPLSGSNQISDFTNQIGPLSYFCLCFSFPVALMHLSLLGVPAFIIGRNAERINWLSTLTVSFFIGAIPWALLGSLIAPANSTFQWAIVFGAVMGVLGSSGGMTFWVLWNHWILPLWPNKESLSSISMQD